MRLWPSLGRDLATLETKDAESRRYSAGSRYVITGVPMSDRFDERTLDQNVDAAWGRVIWVYRAIDARAKNAARLPVKVNDGRGMDAKEILNHPITKRLNKRANPYESGFAFRYRLHTLMDLSPKGVFVEVIENRGGVTQMHLLDPQLIFPIPDPDRFVAGFEMRLATGEVFDNLPPYEQGNGGVVWIKRPHPTDPYSSSTWLAAAGISIDLDFYARTFNRNFLLNDGRPGGVLTVHSEGGLEDGTAEELKLRLGAGPGKAGQVQVLEADALSYTDLSTTPRDAQYVESRALTKQEILVAAGTPLSVIGDASGRTFDNADAEFENFWLVEMQPECDLVASFWEELTPGGIDDDSQVVTYAYDTVEPLQRAIRAREARLANDFTNGLISLDEYRDETGRDPLDLPGSRVVWLTAGKAPVGTPEDVAAIMGQGASPPGGPPSGTGNPVPEGTNPSQTPPGTQPSAQGGANNPAEPTGPGRVGTPTTSTAEDNLLAQLLGPEQKALNTDPYGKARAAHAALLAEWETQVNDELAALLTRQAKVIQARLHGAKARKHTRHWDGADLTREIKALDANYIIDRSRWIDEVVAAIGDIVRAAFTAAGQAALADLGSTDTFTPTPDGLAAVAATVRVIAEGFDARAGKLQQIVTDADAAGATIDEIAQQVTDAMLASDTWSQVASRQVVGAMNAGSLIGGVQGGAVNKRWLAVEDARTRPTHAAAEGQVQPVDQPFHVGAATLMFPGDPTGPPDEVINCRCTQLFQLPARDFNAELDALGIGAP